MSRNFATILVIFLMITAASSLYAQETEPQETKSQETESQETPPAKQPVKSFQLLRDSSSAANELNFEDEEAEIWVPRIDSGTIEVSFGFGFLDFNKVLWEHDQIIYKFTTDATYWGDVKIKGESAFNPVLRLGYSITPWFALEAVGGLAITEYNSTITNRRTRDNKPGAPIQDDPPLGEFDAEIRSLLTIQAALNAVVYPLAIFDDGTGKLHPFLTAGAGKMWYEMNSNYFDGASGTNDLNFGGGVRLLADKNISVRFEVIAHFNEIEFTPSPNFTTQDEGTIVVPLNEYPRNEDGSVDEKVITEFSSQTLSLLNWSIGIQGSF